MTWDYTAKNYNKQAKADPVWALERQILYGLGKKKLDRTLLKKYLPQLNITPDQRAFLELIVWNKPS